MKVWIDYDEWYPVFTVDSGEKSAKYNLKPWGVEVEMSEEDYAEMNAVFEKFNEVQKRLKVLSGYKD
jgi:hypothetical protein